MRAVLLLAMPLHVAGSDETVLRYEPPLGLAGTDWSARASGRLHMDFRRHSAAVDGARSTFEVRRARLGVEVAFEEIYEVEVNGDFSETGARLDTGFINLNLSQTWKVRAGKFKMPFSLEELTSSNYTDFQERSLANTIAPGKLTGIMLHGSPLAGLHYAGAFANGVAGSRRDDNDSKDFIARVAFNAADRLELWDTVLHLGVALTQGRTSGAVPDASTEGRGREFFAVGNFSTDTALTRIGIEWAWARDALKLQGEYLHARYAGDADAGHAFARDLYGSYVAVLWLPTGERHVDAYKQGVFGRIRPRTRFRPGNGAGAVEVGLRLSRFDASSYSAQNAAGTGRLEAGSTNGARAVTAGIMWIHNDHTRLLFNLVRTTFAFPVGDGGGARTHEWAATLRAQVNF